LYKYCLALFSNILYEVKKEQENVLKQIKIKVTTKKDVKEVRENVRTEIVIKM
jgi:hypothetical protein